jgi:hypothetical protein
MGAFNGSGLFVRTYNWVADKVNGVNITASRMDTEDDGYAAGLSLCVTRDGQGKMNADFLPAVDGAYNCGTVAFRWSTVNAGAMALTGNATVAGTLGVTGNSTLTGTLSVGGLSVVGGTRAVKTADQVVALITPQNDTHLVCALAANTYYAVEGAFYVTVASGSPTLTWQLSATNANQIEALSIQEIQAGNNQGVSNNGAVVAAAVQIGVPSAGGIAVVYLKGLILTNAGTAPTLTLQWCGSTGVNITFKKGSYLEFRKVG